jgi:predicted secreted Zn-dependent protease
VSSATLTATYTITLPKWSGPSRVPAALVTWWKDVFGHFVWHEGQHLAIAQSYEPKFRNAILAGPCDQAAQTKIVAQVESKLEAAQAAFDASDSYTYPPLA